MDGSCPPSRNCILPLQPGQNMWWEMDGPHIPSLTGRMGSSSSATWSTGLRVWQCLDFRPLGWKRPQELPQKGNLSPEEGSDRHRSEAEQDKNPSQLWILGWEFSPMRDPPPLLLCPAGRKDFPGKLPTLSSKFWTPS